MTKHHSNVKEAHQHHNEVEAKEHADKAVKAKAPAKPRAPRKPKAVADLTGETTVKKTTRKPKAAKAETVSEKPAAEVTPSVSAELEKLYTKAWRELNNLLRDCLQPYWWTDKLLNMDTLLQAKLISESVRNKWTETWKNEVDINDPLFFFEVTCRGAKLLINAGWKQALTSTMAVSGYHATPEEEFKREYANNWVKDSNSPNINTAVNDEPKRGNFNGMMTIQEC